MARSSPSGDPELGGDSPEPSGIERDLPGALHEVSNALTVVLGWLECARDEMENPDIATRAVDIAMTHAKLGRRIARRAIGDDSEALEEETNLDALVHDAVTGVEREALRRRVSVRVSSDPGDGIALARAAPSLLQVMTNLLLNAVAMSPEGSVVRVESATYAAEAQVSVIDAGPGVEPARRGAIFAGGQSTRHGGAGVGLRHAHDLAAACGGRLSLGESERGARFDVRWPVVTLRPPVARISSLPGLSLEGLRVLLVEDDDAVIGLLSTALSLRGATVHAARSPTELEAATDRHVFDAALLDLSPIAADVGGALARVHARCPRATLVLISGSAAEIPPAARDRMAAWVRKPFEVSEVLAVLRRPPLDRA